MSKATQTLADHISEDLSIDELSEETSEETIESPEGSGLADPETSASGTDA